MKKQMARSHAIITLATSSFHGGGFGASWEPLSNTQPRRPPDVDIVSLPKNKKHDEIPLRNRSGSKQKAGVGGKVFPSLIKDLRHVFDANFFLLYETNISGNRGEAVKNNLGLDGRFMEEAIGHSNSIWILWDSGV
ncbi:hypothetical protein AHAS_Ahas17G0158500 [Arachis hypogaea]